MLKRTLQRIVAVQDSEIRALLWSCAYFFCVLASYSVLRPLREQMGIKGGTQNLKWLFTGTFVGMLIANPLYAAIVTRYPRRKFIPIAYHFFSLNLLGFYLALRFLPADSAANVARVFFVWLSVFNLFVISVFWSFMADIFGLEQSKRLFGFIAVGGSLGAIAGSGLTVALAEFIGPVNLFWLSIVFLQGAVLAVRVLVRVCNVEDEFAPRARAPAAIPAAVPLEQTAFVEGAERGGLFTGIQLVLRSPYLQGICLYLFFYTLSSTFLYFEQAHIVEAAVTSDAGRTELFASIDFWVNVISIAIQIFLTGRIIRAFGVGFMLFSQPLLALVAFACLGWSPTLGVIVAIQVILRASNFAMAKPARETLYTVVGREAKYKSKSFIDTFIYRGGDALGGWAFDGLQKLALSLSQIAFIGVPIAVAWIAVGVLLGKKQERLAEARGEVSSSGEADAVA